MPHYDETEVARLVRGALEGDEPASQPTNDATPCGSYSSLLLLLTGAGSSFVSAEHIGQCSTCQRMLARLLARHCPSTGVLKQYRKPDGDFANIAVLGWHIVGCKWCRLRFAFTPRIASDSQTRSVWREHRGVLLPHHLALAWLPRAVLSRHSLAIAYSMALLAVLGCVWFGLSLRNEQREAALQQRQWAQATNRAQSRVEELTRQLQALNSKESATAHTTDNSGRVTLFAKDRQESGLSTTAPLVATFTLSIGSERGDSGLNEFSIPARATRAQLTIPLSSHDYHKYRVTLKKPEGEQIFVHDAVYVAREKQLVIESPVSVLADGDYILTVTGIDANGRAKAVVDNYAVRFTHVAQPTR